MTDDADLDYQPEPVTVPCPGCAGTREVCELCCLPGFECRCTLAPPRIDCPECSGSGRVTPDELDGPGDGQPDPRCSRAEFERVRRAMQ